MEIGKRYIIRVSVGNRILTYTCKILEIDEFFIKFEDKYGEIQNYNKNSIVNFEEVRDD